jgi:hypothetical protein
MSTYTTLAVASLVGLLAAVATRPQVSAASPVDRARAYAVEWRRALTALVAEEAYTQTAAVRPSRTRGEESPDTVRALVSDVLFVRSYADDRWLMFRDVTAVDGTTIPDRQRRFDALFLERDADVIASARRIADESARFNVGSAIRNVNTPVAALIFLEPLYESSTRWKTEPAASTDNGIVVLSFEQRRAPFAIRTPGGKPQPVAGRLWVEDSGRIVRSELSAEASEIARIGLATRVRRARTRITAAFGPVNGIDFWVPLEMEEEIVIEDGHKETIEGRAVYRNHRLFRTSGRVIGQR